MRGLNRIALAGALLFPARALAAQPAPAAESLALAERAAVEAIAREGFAAAMTSLLSQDGALLWPGAPVLSGPAHARRLLLAQRGLDSLRISWQPLGLETSRDGTMGVSWGVAVAVAPDRSARIGRYIAAWRRVGDAWKLAAFVPLGLVASGGLTLPPELAAIRHSPLAPSPPGGAAAFIAADLAFARLAGDSGAALAFERFAAPDAVTGGALLNQGPAAIGRAVGAGPPSHWTWHPVLAGASAAGDLGYTVGESVIRPQAGPATYGKYLTIWRRRPNGEIRYLTDGGNARPSER